MNFEKFEDRNWFQLIRNRVIRISDGSIIKQDFLSTLLLINVIAILELKFVKIHYDIIEFDSLKEVNPCNRHLNLEA